MLEDYGVAAAYRVSADVAARLAGYRWVHLARQPDAPAFAPSLRVSAVRLSYDFCDEWDGELVASLAPHLEVAFFSGDENAAADAV